MVRWALPFMRGGSKNKASSSGDSADNTAGTSSIPVPSENTDNNSSPPVLSAISSKSVDRKSLPENGGSGKYSKLRQLFLQSPRFPDEQWYYYSVEYDTPGPLMLNVMGTTNKDKSGYVLSNWIIVTSFESYADGKPGRSELSGVIGVKDCVVGVNEIDLTSMTFNDAMDKIGSCPWPKTIHFMRDLSISVKAAIVEGWALVFYPSLNRRRKRYIEFCADVINFRKPAVGGSASGARDSYFRVNQITQIRPIADSEGAADQQYILQLVCIPGAMIDHVDEDDMSLGGSPVEILELCFMKMRDMNTWRSALASPFEASCHINVLPISTVARNDAFTTESFVLGIKSHVTGKFSVREVTLSGGVLRWRRMAEKGHDNSGANKDRGLFIANSSYCALRSIRAVKDNNEQAEYRFQLILQTYEHSLTLGMKDQATITTWLKMVKEVVDKCKSETEDSSYIPEVNVSTDFSSAANSPDKSGSLSTPNASAGAVPKSPGSRGPLSPTGNPPQAQGYLYKKTERRGSAPSTDTETYTKRYFVLFGHELFYYKSHSDYLAASKPSMALGCLDLRAALAVREARDATAPENAIEIVTPTRLYQVIAEDEDELIRWINMLGDVLENRAAAIQREKDPEAPTGSVPSTPAVTSPPENLFALIDEKRKSFLQHGVLKARSVNHLTNSVTWKERFFYIANGALTYYETENDIFDFRKDPLGDISLISVRIIETPPMERVTEDAATLSAEAYEHEASRCFDVHAFVRRGGNADGIRIFTLKAESATSCRVWMDTLCNAIGTLEMAPKEDGAFGLRAVKSEQLVKKKDLKRIISSMVYANKSTVKSIQNISEVAGENITRESEVSDPADSSSSISETFKLSAKTSGSPPKLMSVVAEATAASRRNNSVLSQPGSVGGRGGRGRGRGFASATSARTIGDTTEPNT